MKHELPKLAYAYDALEPYIDAKTMEIHYTKHHQAYVDKLNAVLEKYPDLANKELAWLTKELPNLKMEEGDKTILKNHGGGHLNHSRFWEIMGPKKEPDKTLGVEIEKTFGSREDFKKLFTQAAVSHFGSGWTWLARDLQGGLVIYSMPNQDSPYLKGHTPLIGLDVWEHAYYLKYQNRRPEYVENWWDVLKLV